MILVGGIIKLNYFRELSTVPAKKKFHYEVSKNILTYWVIPDISNAPVRVAPLWDL